MIIYQFLLFEGLYFPHLFPSCSPKLDEQIALRQHYIQQERICDPYLSPVEQSYQ